jgi:cystathionine beta-synthase
VVGIIDESDLLMAGFAEAARFGEPVRNAMSARLETVAADAPLDALLPIFDKGHVVIVVDQGKFLGLITRIDLVNHLRHRID